MPRIAQPVLIIGSNGQLGQALIRRWRGDATRDEPIIALARSREALDVTNREQVMSSVLGCRPSVVVNCSGFTNVGQAEGDAQRCWLTNVLGVRHLIEACIDANSALIQVSPDLVFSHDQALSLNPSAATGGFTEEAIPAAYGEYALSKLAAETELQIVGQREQLRYWLVRTSGLFERPWRSSRSFMFAVALRLFESRTDIPVVDDVTTTICSADYLAEVVDWIVTEQIFRHAPSSVYHAAQGGQATWYAIAQYLATQLGLPGRRIVPTTREGYARQSGRQLLTLPRYTPLNCRRLEQASGLTPLSWRAAVEEWASLAKDYF